MKKRFILLTSSLFLFSCAATTAGVDNSIAKSNEDDKIEKALLEISNKLEKLKTIDKENSSMEIKEENNTNRPVDKPGVNDGNKTNYMQPLNNLERKYTFTAKGMSLGSAIAYTFPDFSIVFDDGVDLQKPVTVVLKDVEAEDACKKIASSAGYWCDIDKDKRKIVIKEYAEATIQLPDGIDELTYETNLGGDVLKGGSSGGMMGGGMGMTGGGMMGGGMGMGGSGGMTANSKVGLKGSSSIKSIEEFFKSFLSENGDVKVNPITKTLYVKDKPDRVEAIKKFVEDISSMLNKNVYIEAKVFYVITNESLETGINWSKTIMSGGNTIGVNLSSQITNSALSVSYAGNTLSGIINLLSTKGEIHEIVSPSIKTLNLVPATLVRGTNIPYVSYNPVINNSGLGTVTDNQISISYAFDGVSLFIKPYALRDKIYLTIQPSISTVDRYEQFTDSQKNTMKIPVTSITSQVTKLSVENDHTVLMGGLVWDGKQRVQTGIPLLDSIPLLGRLFKSDSDTTKKVYLFIAVYSKVE